MFGKTIIKFVAGILLLATSALNAKAQDVTIKASFDSVGILLGDQIFFNIIAEQPLGAKIQFPIFSDTLTNKIEIISATPADTFYINPQKIRVSRKYLVTSFDSGDYKIDFIKFPFTYNGKNDTAYSNALLLYVRAIPIKEPDKIADIKPVIAFPYTIKEIAMYAGMVIGILLIIAILAYIYIRWKQNKPIFNILAKPVEPPHVVAFRALEQLRGEKLWQQGFFKQYYSRLTDIARTYIEARFRVPAMESTTDEIMNELKNIALIDQKLKDGLKAMLAEADLVKFAKAEPLPDENENAWVFVNDFVSKTYKDPEPEINAETENTEQAER